MDGLKRINELYVMKTLSCVGYKLYALVKHMSLEGKADEQGWVHLSHNQIRQKAGINNVSRVVDYLLNHSDIIEVQRGPRGMKGGVISSKFKINSDLLK